MLHTLQTLDRGSSFIKNVRECIRIADRLTRTLDQGASPSLIDHVIDQALGKVSSGVQK